MSTHYDVHFANKALEHYRETFQREVLAIARRNDLALASRFGRPVPQQPVSHTRTVELMESAVRHFERGRVEDRIKWAVQIGFLALQAGADLLEQEALDPTSGDAA